MKAAWVRYNNFWTDQSPSLTGSLQLVWPVTSGRLNDVRPDTVSGFICSLRQILTSDELEGADYLTILKRERIRWHPDRMGHLLANVGAEQDQGSRPFEIDPHDLTRTVTMVFQVIDDLYNVEMKETENKTHR